MYCSHKNNVYLNQDFFFLQIKFQCAFRALAPRFLVTKPACCLSVVPCNVYFLQVILEALFRDGGMVFKVHFLFTNDHLLVWG